mmetsp:Transcript_28898/g.45775  ORF Transcript_28898/g.45775 Transcript_28898/m.45775 type:complete len:410 (-) Transcript_28898:5-1234(-)
MKAIRCHRLTVEDNQLYCKYYKREYGLIRNQPAGICHVLALILYIDISAFCTKFRETYRRIGDETEEHQVEGRHKQLYNYGRFLYEAIEFFGKRMENKLEVYHGLNRVLYFGEFTAYFNQPISTTPRRHIADRFANAGGIVLTLKTGAQRDGETEKSPKYIEVTGISAFPEEEEKLFYGEYVQFQIVDIMHAGTGKAYKKEMRIFNRFQRWLQNREIKWSKWNVKDVQFLKEHILRQIQAKSQQQPELEYIDDLFDHFCRDKMRRSMHMHDFPSLPEELLNALFYPDSQKKKRFSLKHIVAVFPEVESLHLQSIKLQTLTANAKAYIQGVFTYLVSCMKEKKGSMLLREISFESETDTGNNKKSQVLEQSTKSIRKTVDAKYPDLQWKIEYKQRPSENGQCHQVLFEKI